MKSHRNYANSIEIPFDFENFSDAYRFRSDICSNEVNLQEEFNNDTIDNYECYICKQYFANTTDLKSHLSKHILYEKWIDPINIYLSNWNPQESLEILQNQPLVLVENLNIKNIDLKSLDNIAQQSEHFVKQLREKNECMSLYDQDTVMEVENGHQYDYVGRVEMVSNNEYYEPCQNQIMKNELLLPDPSPNCANGNGDFALAILDRGDNDWPVWHYCNDDF